MALMDWRDALSVGFPVIDTQHKRLVQLLNDLHAAMQEGRSRQAMGDVLNGLISYTGTHFAAEEKIMVQHAYPGYADQKKQHEDLLKRVNAFKTDFESGKVGLNMELMNFLSEWVNTHIVGTDKKLGAYLVSKGVK